MRPAFAVPRPSGAALAAARLLALAAAIACVAPSAQAQNRVANPFVGATWYLSPEYAKNVAASAAQVSDPTLKAQVARVATYPTAFWLDRIAAIDGSATRMGLAAHLDAALLQRQGNQPVVVIVVIYNLPGRDCSALASNGELGPNDLGRYKTEYIDKIAAIEADAKYAALRIVNIIEIDSLPNIVTNVAGKAGATALCDTMKANGNYVAGVQYALGKLHEAPNTYNYIDAAHHGWLGWDDNFNASAQLFADTARGAPGGFATVQGFITNTANYSALAEPFLTVTDQTRQSKWLDWNRYVDERSFAAAFRTKLVSLGFDSGIGMLIDTSRNGWGGPSRPTQASTSSDVNTMVNASRIDRRIHAGNWCNQSGAGLGERPQAVGADGIHAYVWVKPPGESDGASKEIANSEGKGFDRMCDPTYTGNARNGNSLTGSLSDAPLSGAWFHAQLVELVQNAYPAVPADGGSSSGGSSSGGSSSGGSSSGGSSSGGSSSGGSSSGGSSADFQLAASPASVTLNQGQSGASTILLGKSGGFSASVSLSASGLPAGVTASFQPASTSGQSVVTFSATSSAATGTTTATITGTSGGLTHTVNVFLTVNAAGSPSFALSTSPASLSIAQGASASSTVSVQPSDGFSGTVGLSAEGLPSGITATFDNQYPTSSTKVTFTATATAATGSAIATIVGTAGNVTRSTTVALTVTGSSGGSSSGGSSSGGSSSGGSGSGGSSGGASSSGGTSSGGGSSSGGSSGGTSSGGGSSSGGPRQPGSVGGCSSTGAADAGAFLIALLGAARLRLRRRPV